MPWTQHSALEMRTRFIADALNGRFKSHAELCRRYNISGKTGCKWLKRYEELKWLGLLERSRRPRACPHETPDEVVLALLEMRRRHLTWSAKNLLTHTTLKDETNCPPEKNLRAQQRRFDAFRDTYNHECPHDPLDQKTPGSLYELASRSYPDRLPPVEHPGHFEVRKVSANRGVRWKGRYLNLSTVLLREYVGFEEVDDGSGRLTIQQRNSDASMNTPSESLTRREMSIESHITHGTHNRDQKCNPSTRTFL